MPKANDIKDKNAVKSIIREISNPDQETKTTDATISNNTNTGVTHSLAGRTTGETIDVDRTHKPDDIKDENVVGPSVQITHYENLPMQYTEIFKVVKNEKFQ